MQEETRARFFTPISTNNGVIAYRDSTAQINPNSGRVPRWSDVEYKPLLRNFSDASQRMVLAGCALQPRRIAPATRWRCRSGNLNALQNAGEILQMTWLRRH